MQKIKTLFATVVVGGLSVFLFFMGLGLMLMLFVVMMIIGLFVRPSTRQNWQTRWSSNWKTRQENFTERHRNVRETDVIEGEYTVQPH